MIQTRQSGFTLIEMLLSVAIIGLLCGLSLPVYETFVRRNDLDIAGQNLTSTLRRAASYARAVNYDSAWSVRIQPTSLVLFRGTTFVSRDIAFDETVPIPGSITPAGLIEIQFAKFTGAPSVTGNVMLTSTTNDIRTVSVNAKGTVSY